MASSQVVFRDGKIYERVVYQQRPRGFKYKSSNGIQPYSQRYERDPYSQRQNFLFKRALYGLSVYTEQEIEEMHRQKRDRIRKVHKRAQRELNLWKQQLVNDWTNTLFTGMFPNNNITRDLVEGSCVDPAFKNTIPFKDLGITKDQIVEKLMESGILPIDFYTSNQKHAS